MTYSESRDLLPAVSRERSYQPKKWTAFHRYLVALEAAGARPGEIARATGLSAGRVSVILNDPRAEIERTQIASNVADTITDVSLRFKLLSNESLDEVVDLMRNCEDPKVRQKSALEILDRGGYSKFQGEHVPRLDFGEKTADRIEAALDEIQAVEGLDYEIEEAS